MSCSRLAPSGPPERITLTSWILVFVAPSVGCVVDERVKLVPAAQIQAAGQPNSREIRVTLRAPCKQPRHIRFKPAPQGVSGASASQIQVTVRRSVHAGRAGLNRIPASIHSAFVLALAIARDFDATAALGAV